MRIGLFTDTYPPEINGVANSTFLLNAALVKAGHDVYVITTNSQGHVESHWEDNGHLLRLKGTELSFLYGYVLTSPFHFKALQEIRELNLDVIHCQTEFGVGIFAHICASQLDLPIVSTYHTTYEDYTHYVNFINSHTLDAAAKKLVARLSRLYGNHCNAVIAPSEKTKKMLERYKIQRNISIIPTGLKLDDFDPVYTDRAKSIAIRKQYGIDENTFLCISIGRLANEKSIDVVLGWMQACKKENLDVKLLVVGDGPQKGDYESLSKTLGIEDIVIFAGAKMKDEIPDYYRSANAFVSASLSETQGMTFIESLASGVPLFARYDDVLEHLIVKEETGWFCNTSEEFMQNIKHYMHLSDSDKQAIRENCVEKVKPMSYEVFGEKVLQVYTKAIKEFFNTWLIDDIQVKDSFVQLYLENDQKMEARLQVSLDDYAEFGLRKNRKITNEQFAVLRQKEASVKAYQSCLNKLAVKDRTYKEIEEFLTYKTECDEESRTQILDKLQKQGYINDERYCQEAIHSLLASMYGPERIARQLVKKGIDEAFVREQLEKETDATKDEAVQYAKRIVAMHKGDSMKKLKTVLYQKLMQRGFDHDTTTEAINGLCLVKIEERELDNLKKCATKAKRRYEKKYTNSELRNRIFRYCMSQGYDSDDIYAVIDEMEILE